MIPKKFSLVFLAEQNELIGCFGFIQNPDYFFKVSLENDYCSDGYVSSEGYWKGGAMHGRQSHTLPFPQVVQTCRLCKAATNVG